MWQCFLISGFLLGKLGILSTPTALLAPGLREAVRLHPWNFWIKQDRSCPGAHRTILPVPLSVPPLSPSMEPRAWEIELGLVVIAIDREVSEDIEAELEGLDHGQTLPEACGPAVQHDHIEMTYTVFL